MPPSLITLPYEVLSFVVEDVSIEDVKNLAQTCRKLQFLEHEENICRKLLQAKLSHSPEVGAATGGRGGGYAKTVRRIFKRHESITTASPYSVSVVGLCDSHLYCNGVLCYILDDKLRILDLHRSHSHETTVEIPALLRECLPDLEEVISGKFRILYFNEGIISCLYRLAASDSIALLIVFNLEGHILLAHRLDATERIFVRHNSEVFYYGIHTGDINERHKKWILRGYQWRLQKWFDQSIYLPELIGADIGSTVCFEIINDYFYALSNQTTYDVEEVDWTSFYHCARFPTRSPCKELIEKTHEDNYMWRRQHREGPIDDRWGSLNLCLDAATGDVNIVEMRREFTSGASTSHRTCYTTKVVFPENIFLLDQEECSLSCSVSSSKLSDQSCSSNSSGSTSGLGNLVAEVLPSFPTSPKPRRRLESHEWVAVTNDRLALTITASDNPHWHPPQPRLPRNVHPSIDGPFVLARTPLRYYDSSTNAFIDLVDDRLVDRPDKQRLRIRVDSRQLAPPLRDSSGLLIPEERHPLTDDLIPGNNEIYIPRNVAFWPPNQTPGGPSAEALEDLYSILNPPSHDGNVHGTADSRSIIYVTGGNQYGQPQAIIFINFDATIRLQGLQNWGHPSAKASFAHHESRGGTASAGRAPNEQGLNSRSMDVKGKGKEKKATSDQDAESHVQTNPSDLPSWNQRGERGSVASAWMKTEAAMHLAINRGYSFGWVKTA